jgi:hypothetical protein
MGIQTFKAASISSLRPPRLPGCEAIVTNPPYKSGLDGKFAAKALALVPKVYMLCRLAFLESQRRSSVLDGGCLARVYAFKSRLPMMHRDGWQGPKAQSAMAFAWFVWDRNHRGGKPKIERIGTKRCSICDEQFIGREGRRPVQIGADRKPSGDALRIMSKGSANCNGASLHRCRPRPPRMRHRSEGGETPWLRSVRTTSLCSRPMSAARWSAGKPVPGSRHSRRRARCWMLPSAGIGIAVKRCRSASRSARSEAGSGPVFHRFRNSGNGRATTIMTPTSGLPLRGARPLCLPVTQASRPGPRPGVVETAIEPVQLLWPLTSQGRPFAKLRRTGTGTEFEPSPGGDK